MGENELSRDQVEWACGTYFTNLTMTRARVADELARGQMVSSHNLGSLLKAQADWKLYGKLQSDEAYRYDLVGALRETVKEASRILRNTGRHTDAVDRAQAEFERHAAAAFLNTWEQYL